MVSKQMPAGPDRAIFWRDAVQFLDLAKVVASFVRLHSHQLPDRRSFIWRRLKGCNLARRKADARTVCGFDETFVEWDAGDTHSVLRLHDKRIIRRPGAWATEMLPLWHKPADHRCAMANEKIPLGETAAAPPRRRADQKVNIVP